MASVEMSLDDIIALQRSTKPRGGFRGGRRSNNNNNSNRDGGFRRSGNNNFRKSSYVDHDAPRSSPTVTRPSGPGGNPNKVVRVNLTNLAPTVVSADLDELFDAYDTEAATVHYDESGSSCGTGDVFLKRRDAIRLIRDFEGVALDQQVIKMFLVDGTQSLGSRVDYGGNRSRGGVTKRYSGGGMGGGRSAGRGGSRGGPRRDRRDGRRDQVKKSDAELDAELDAYMTKRA